MLVGYGLLYNGLQTIQGCSPHFLDVMWPGKYTPCKGGWAGSGATNPKVTAPSTLKNVPKSVGSELGLQSSLGMPIVTGLP